MLQTIYIFSRNSLSTAPTAEAPIQYIGNITDFDSTIPTYYANTFFYTATSKRRKTPPLVVYFAFILPQSTSKVNSNFQIDKNLIINIILTRKSSHTREDFSIILFLQLTLPRNSVGHSPVSRSLRRCFRKAQLRGTLPALLPRGGSRERQTR